MLERIEESPSIVPPPPVAQNTPVGVRRNTHEPPPTAQPPPAGRWGLRATPRDRPRRLQASPAPAHRRPATNSRSKAEFLGGCSVPCWRTANRMGRCSPRSGNAWLSSPGPEKAARGLRPTLRMHREDVVVGSLPFPPFALWLFCAPLGPVLWFFLGLLLVRGTVQLFESF